MDQLQPSSDNPNTAVNFRRERVKFADFSFVRTPAGQCSAEVTLEWDGALFAGKSSGQSSPLGDFRVAAEAALRARDDSTKGALRLEPSGANPIGAPDATLRMLSVSSRENGQYT